MYDEIVKKLWECASGECLNCSQYTETTNASVCSKELMKQAANAIEELVRKEKFHAFLWNTIQPNEMEAYISMYNAENEKVETK